MNRPRRCRHDTIIDYSTDALTESWVSNTVAETITYDPADAATGSSIANEAADATDYSAEAITESYISNAVVDSITDGSADAVTPKVASPTPPSQTPSLTIPPTTPLPCRQYHRQSCRCRYRRLHRQHRRRHHCRLSSKLHGMPTKSPEFLISWDDLVVVCAVGSAETCPKRIEGSTWQS